MCIDRERAKILSKLNPEEEAGYACEEWRNWEQDRILLERGEVFLNESDVKAIAETLYGEQ